MAGCYLERRDTLVVAPTGSGKTLAYLLPLFISMQQPCRAISGPEAKGIRSLIVVPTYDLAVQIRDVAESLASGRKWRIMLLSKPTEHAVVEAANGGEDALGIDILICTPERLHHLIDQGNVHLARYVHPHEPVILTHNAVCSTSYSTRPIACCPTNFTSKLFRFWTSAGTTNCRNVSSQRLSRVALRQRPNVT